MLSIDDLTYRLGDRILFDQAGVFLPPRSRAGFVGRNGAGKTTLFRLISGDIAPESGKISLPARIKLGRVEQEAPGGPTALVDFVLAADVERAELIAREAVATDPHEIAEIHTRLVDIEAHAAPARAGAILAGLGFDAEAQQRPLSEFSGGWRMRVALAAVLFSRPELLLLDEPTNYLDLEGTLWLVDYLARYPASVVVISHDRDLLDDVATHILHLERGKLTLYKGNYSSFEKQRLEAQALAAKAGKKQEERRRELQAFVDRFRAKATKARQAQSRLKMLSRLEPVTAVVDDEVLPIHLPSPEKPLSPPIIALDKVSVGYGERIVLSRLSLSLSNDDRIGLLGSNGNGKSTFAKLLAGRLEAKGGQMVRAPKLEAGFFAQHQIDDLNDNDTPYSVFAALMPDAPEARIRARAARTGFSGARADTKVAHLSGGEKARLLLGVASFHGPHLLILDEPTNHLDIDSRAALIEAINMHEGAIVLVSHDRYLLQACADRLWLVDGGTVRAFDGDMDDYARMVLGRAGADARKERETQEEAPEKRAKTPRKDAGQARRKLAAAEERMQKLGELLARVDAALADPQAYSRNPQETSRLSQQRAELADALAGAEEQWLKLADEA
ncbi:MULTISPECIES: ABC-F family ATP-binding cassette domain-containing protein [Methylosinus]|uniref:ABC transporter ATP-binding protein n=1 Tax=Methylosinus trichosporium (strain ATCC 35070 / NCIMB 11131 / UNIQEM 75 / OB3b) TaxID=595536 RepID=A0A2D2CV83_METT3|nr:MULTISPECIES: ABC-F family ATP-binding cassette domain-containing protein [Methylosinus]ATQ66600.1 ABC transporter ATP-binding protein [Methylosinus trichosporium OB3b]OBS51682.1 glycosyl transferase family 1 [Methylosinus sp. 3S-1]